ncbi:MAG: hypothetical protein AB1439_08435 [candidate division FCPU426 bacterium]
MKTLAKMWLAVILIIFASSPLEAAQSSANYQLNQMQVSSTGNTQESSGIYLFDSSGESLVGQSWSGRYSVQAGYFNDYFLPAPTPTVTPTPIRSFGGEVICADYVYAAPNPIRGKRGTIHFDLAMRAEVELKVFTVNGDLVISQHWASLPLGSNSWTWDTSNIANGVYLLWIKAKSEAGKTTTLSKKIALVK